MVTNENEIPEIVGSKDLREVFAAKPVVRGTFFLNRIEIVPLAAAGIASLLDQINRYADKTFVDASVDENYHLVLEARSPAPILTRTGRLLDPTAAEKEYNTVLVDLGLPETQPGLAATAVVHGVAPGPAPEERRRLRQERAVKSGAIPASALADLPNKLATNQPTSEHVAQVIAEAKKFYPDGPLPDWIEDLAKFTEQPTDVGQPGPEQRQEAPNKVNILSELPGPTRLLPPVAPMPEQKPRAKLPEIGWGGDIDNRGPIGFPS